MAGMIVTLPEDVIERWVDVPCDCGGRSGPHSNSFRLFDGDLMCVAALDEDEVIYKWRVDLAGTGKVCFGYAHTMSQAQQAAEWSAQAMITDRAAYYERHPEDKPLAH